MSTVRPLTATATTVQLDGSPVNIFLLERDLPKDIERLGIVSILPTSQVAIGLDNQVKQQLKEDCKRLGANGAYRISDGTYSSLVISYLVFRYEK